MFICVCLAWGIYLQSATWFIGSIMSRPKTSWTGLFSLVLWYVYCTAKAAAANIPIHGSASSTYISCRLYVRCNWCILSMTAFDCGLPEEAGLVLIPYSFYIKLFLNSWPRNSHPQSYMIYTGHVYQTSHIVSTMFAIVIDFLSLYCATSNHLVTGCIILTTFKHRGSFYFLYYPIHFISSYF